MFTPSPRCHCRATNQPELRHSVLGKTSDRENIERQSWRIGVGIMPAILLVAALRFTAMRYVVQEALVVLFLVAASTGTILVLAVAFVLVREGIRRTVLWMKIGLVRLARDSCHQSMENEKGTAR